GSHSGKSAATSVLGTVAITHGSQTLIMQTKDGQITEPNCISAGLDCPGVGRLHAHSYKTCPAEFYSTTDNQSISYGFKLCNLESIISAIESSHALAVF